MAQGEVRGGQAVGVGTQQQGEMVMGAVMGALVGVKGRVVEVEMEGVGPQLQQKVEQTPLQGAKRFMSNSISVLHAPMQGIMICRQGMNQQEKKHI
jgi:hypothetical protein